MAGPESEEDHLQPTVAGCLLTLLSLAVVFGLAVPFVRWLHADSEEVLPDELAIFLPILAGALCYGIGSAILGFFGLPVLKKPKKKPTGRADDADAQRR